MQYQPVNINPTLDIHDIQDKSLMRKCFAEGDSLPTALTGEH